MNAKSAWFSFMDLIENFLGNYRVDIYKEIIE